MFDNHVSSQVLRLFGDMRGGGSGRRGRGGIGGGRRRVLGSAAVHGVHVVEILEGVGAWRIRAKEEDSDAGLRRCRAIVRLIRPQL